MPPIQANAAPLPRPKASRRFLESGSIAGVTRQPSLLARAFCVQLCLRLLGQLARPRAFASIRSWRASISARSVFVSFFFAIVLSCE